MPPSPKSASSSRWSSAAKRFQIVAGERRYQAAVQIGLQELPVVIRDVDDTEMLELTLIGNLQRKDLTPFEEAEALHGLAAIPEDVRTVCRLADISSKSLLLQAVRQDTREKTIALIEKMAGHGGWTQKQLRAVVPRPGRPADRFRVRVSREGLQSEAFVFEEPHQPRGRHRVGRRWGNSERSG